MRAYPGAKLVLASKINALIHCFFLGANGGGDADPTLYHTALMLARGRADVGGCGAITAPKRMIEIGQVAEAGLEGNRADHVAGKTRIDQATMHAREPLVQHVVGERGVIALEQGSDGAR